MTIVFNVVKADGHEFDLVLRDTCPLHLVQSAFDDPEVVAIEIVGTES